MSYADADSYGGNDGVLEKSGPSILERLNVDCWRMVLDHVPVEDIVRSERVSRSWQELVHRYLHEVGICFNCLSEELMYENVKMHSKNRIIIIQTKVYQQVLQLQLLEKWGPCVVFCYCSNQVVFEIITKYCPNLKGLSINMHRFGRVHLSQDQVEFAQKLERLVLMYFTDNECRMQPHVCTVEFDHSEVRNINTGRDFWPNFKPTKLKLLVVRGDMDFRQFLSTVELYPELTELWLDGKHENIHCFLEKTPKLERLFLAGVTNIAEDENGLGAEYRLKCSGLNRLKSITAWFLHVKSWWLEAITIGCRELRSLDFRFSNALKYLLELCRAHGQTLTEITLYFDTLENADAAAIIASCPNLTTLDLRSCLNITANLLPAVAHAARNHKFPVHLLIGDTSAGHHCDRDIVQLQYPWLIVDTHSDAGHFDAMRPQHNIRQNIWAPRKMLPVESQHQIWDYVPRKSQSDI